MAQSAAEIHIPVEPLTQAQHAILMIMRVYPFKRRGSTKIHKGNPHTKLLLTTCE